MIGRQEDMIEDIAINGASALSLEPRQSDGFTPPLAPKPNGR